jgi:hypothetical protein
MHAFDRGFRHLRRDRMLAVAGKTIDAGPEQEPRIAFLRRAEQLENVALAVADMNTAIRSQSGRRLTDIL